MSQSNQPPASPADPSGWGNSETPTGGYGQFNTGSWQNPGGTGNGGAAPNSPGFSGAPAGGSPTSAPHQSSSFSSPSGATENPSFTSGTQNFRQVQPGIIPLRPLSLGDIFNGSFRALREAPSVMFGLILGIWAVFSVLTGVITVLAFPDMHQALKRVEDSAANPENLLDAYLRLLEGSLLAGIPNGIIHITVLGVTMGIGVTAIAPLVLGRRPSMSDTWEAVKPHLWKLIGFSFLLDLISMATTMLALSPLILTILGAMNQDLGMAVLGLFLILLTALGGFFLYAFLVIRVIFAIPSMVMENIGVGAAMRRSWALTKGSFWRIFGVIALTYLILGVIMTGLSFVTQLIVTAAIAFSADTTVMMGVSTALNSIMAGIYIPFIAGVQSILYIDLRMRREGLALTLLRAAQQD